MKFDAVIFDLDGTLLDTIMDIADSSNTVLERNGLPPFPLEDFRRFVGRGMKNLVVSLLPRSMHTDADIERITREIEEAYSLRLNVHTKPYPGIPELLRVLDDSGVAKAVLSNKPGPLVKRSIGFNFPETRFSFVFGAGDRYPLKPHPGAALAIAGGIGVSPERIVFLGDTRIDMETAINAGMYPVGAGWGFRGEDELRAAGARKVFTRPEEATGYF